MGRGCCKVRWLGWARLDRWNAEGDGAVGKFIGAGLSEVGGVEGNGVGCSLQGSLWLGMLHCLLCLVILLHCLIAV